MAPPVKLELGDMRVCGDSHGASGDLCEEL
jgi:hypothetical protein